MNVKALLWAAVALCAGLPLWAQDTALPDYRISSPESFLREEEAATHAAIAPGFSLGIRGSYMGDPNDDFDDGELFGGIVARVHLLDMLSIEGFGAYHREDDDGVDTNIWPVQVSALVYFFPNSPVAVYILGGVGWYFFDVEFDHPFEDQDFDDDVFGFHTGLGVEFQVSRHISITIDGRYIWLEDSDDFIPEVTSNDEAYQLMGGVNFDF